MKLSLDKAILCLKLLTEGNSVRSTVRISGVAKGTVLALLLTVGERCERLLRERVKGLQVDEVQADEMWGFVGMKEKAKLRRGIDPDAPLGDAYCFVAIERDSKLILSWHLGRRQGGDALVFMEDVETATAGRLQLTTDGFKPYPVVVDLAFEGRQVDFAQLIKVYSNADDEHRYSPGTVTDTRKVVCCGRPREAGICTSHIERQNLTMRMQVRRLTRLTNAFSKKWANHRAAIALHFAQYNFCQVHGTIKMTPAMKAGLTDHRWSLAELLAEAAKSTQS